MATELSRVRRTIQPLGTDTWQSIAERELAGESLDSAVQQLQSWNLHVFMRPAAPETSPRVGNPILPSDVIFVEPPLNAGQPG
ncbi:MAG: hypothetical protein AAGG11_17325 [Pseudomonadota bacterium]